MKPKTNIRVRLTGENGNIALCALRDGDRGELCQPLTESVTSSKFYGDALCWIAEYVEME